MLICKYEKRDYAAFIPHLDLLRAVGMAVRRQKLDIAFSEGFNPHMRLFFTQPLPLGTESECEYFCADSKDDPAEFTEKINLSLPKGVRVVKAARAGEKVNAANIMAEADYTVTLFPPLKTVPDFSPFLKEDKFIINYVSKGKDVSKDVRGMIKNIRADEKHIYLRLLCGNINLRADRLTEHLLGLIGEKRDYGILKTAMYDKNGVGLDELFFKNN